MKIIHFSEINSALKDGAEEYIKYCSDEYDKSCRGIAESIADSKRPIILLSGPSGSGKTTTALKIEGFLDELGLQTHTVSMDNYFLPKEQIPIPPDGKIDFESPYRIDIPLLKKHIGIFAECGEVEVPQFDFTDQSRAKGKRLKRNKGELILFEGIHALNPEVTGFDDVANCLYVSVRTRIQLSNGSLLHPELIRLMRRMIRDRNYRSRSPEETLEMFDSVQRGENLYINPFKQRAHFQLDTFHGYECSVYKNFLEKDVERLKQGCADFGRFETIRDLIKDIDPLDERLVPNDSMIREFIGGSKYEY